MAKDKSKGRVKDNNNMWEKLKSRKFQALIGGILIALGSALGEKIGFSQAIIAIVTLIIGYFGIEGAVDIARARGLKQ